jgi:Fe2+ transport system protein B
LKKEILKESNNNNTLEEEEEYSTLSSIAEELKLKSKRMNETIKEDDYFIESVNELSNENIQHLKHDHEELKKYETTLKRVNPFYLFLIMFILFIFMYGIIKIFPK